jgi:phenylalanyl-tRNA synthetase beta chain
MTISYNWLCEYLPVKPAIEELGHILTSVGLEVEGIEKQEAVPGGLAGIVIGEVLTCEKHPNADKLRLTTVNIGAGEPLKIVCGAPNVEAGQKVVVATIGATLYPTGGEPFVIKRSKIRGEESEGMICAEDEIGLGESHAGIMILDATAVPGTPAADYFKLPAAEYVYEIGLTPNRMDAMSHLGVARDVCAYLSHHTGTPHAVKFPEVPEPAAANDVQVSITIENNEACKRYAGITLSGIQVGPSPEWMQQHLKSIGVRPINNVVDITNFVLHECGQPLHAFDLAAVKGNAVIVKTLPEGTPFITLDEKERKLNAADLMICNAEAPMCIAGVFGGLHSGVTDATTSLFLESATFDGGSVRSTSFRHGLRTDAAVRFEKGTDISMVPYALKRAVQLLTELAGAKVSGPVQDVYPDPKPKTTVELKYSYLEKVSGKQYAPETARNILQLLGFELVADTEAAMTVAVPYHKTDISLAVDVIEEIMRIDGLDNVMMPDQLRVPLRGAHGNGQDDWKNKVANWLSGKGFSEIFTNSISNSKYYEAEYGDSMVRMINNLSAELDVMRPSLIESGLEAIAWNLNRKNEQLFFYEFGKTYFKDEKGFHEPEKLGVWICGDKQEGSWNRKGEKMDIYYLKGLVESLLTRTGISKCQWQVAESKTLQPCLQVVVNNKVLGELGAVSNAVLGRFDIKAPVWYFGLDLQQWIDFSSRKKPEYKEISKFPSMQRDLALVLDKGVEYAKVEAAVKSLRSPILQSMNLFDKFESEKLGEGKKSYGVSFTFLDPQKTLTDTEIDAEMSKLIGKFEKDLNAIIRK